MTTFYCQKAGGRVRRAIRMSGRKHLEIHNLLSASKKERKWEILKMQGKIHQWCKNYGQLFV